MGLDCGYLPSASGGMRVFGFRFWPEYALRWSVRMACEPWDRGQMESRVCAENSSHARNELVMEAYESMAVEPGCTDVESRVTQAMN